MLFAFPGSESLAAGLCKLLPAEAGTMRWHHFPDGESLLTLQSQCRGRDVVIVCTLRDPDPLAMPLLFAARTARELGARSVGLVAPYLAYMRQDARFHPGEAISSTHFAAFLSWTFDWLVTVDPHLHRHADLGALFSMPAGCVTAMPAIAEWIRVHVVDPVLIGPDDESAQWVQPLGSALGAPTVMLSKRRIGDRDVEVSALPTAAFQGRSPVLVDDIIASGQTLIEILGRLQFAHSPAATCVAVHGVFAQDAYAALLAAGAGRVVTTNTIEHPTNAIDVAGLVAPAIAELIGRASAARSG